MEYEGEADDGHVGEGVGRTVVHEGGEDRGQDHAVED